MTSKAHAKPTGKPVAEHPFGMEIYSRDQRESFILHASNLSQEILKSNRFFLDAQIAFAYLVCKEVTGERSPALLADVIANLSHSRESLSHTRGLFAYLDTIVLELQEIDLKEKEVDLGAIGTSLVAQDAVRDVAWNFVKASIVGAHFTEAYDAAKKHIAEVGEFTEKLIAALQRDSPAAREGTAAHRLMKMRPVNIAVEFGILRTEWDVLIDILFIIEICGKECWYNLKNYRPVLPLAPGV